MDLAGKAVVEKMKGKDERLRGRIGGLYDGIILLFTSSFSLPKALGLSAAAILIFIMGFMVFITLVVSCFVMGLSCLVSILAGVSIWNMQAAAGTFYIGIGLCILGFDLLFVLITLRLWRAVFGVIGRLFERVLQKEEQGGVVE